MILKLCFPHGFEASLACKPAGHRIFSGSGRHRVPGKPLKAPSVSRLVKFAFLPGVVSKAVGARGSALGQPRRKLVHASLFSGIGTDIMAMEAKHGSDFQ